MAKKEKGNQEMITETAAAATLATHPNQSSRAQMMLDIVNLFQWMDADKMSEALAQMQNLSAPTEGMAAGNQASVQTGNKGPAIPTQAMKEDMEALFGSSELSEEFKQKFGTIFEATVNTRLIAETARLEEEFAKKLEEQTEEIVGQLVEEVDKYVTLTAEEWLEANKVAIDNSLRAEIAEDFIAGLHKLFSEHYMTVPESKIDVVEGLADRVAELETSLNEKTQTIIQMSEILEHYAQQEVFDEVAEGLALTQQDKLKKLAEGVEFTGDIDDYKKKLEILKEHNFAVKPTNQKFDETNEDNSNMLTENNNAGFTDPSIASYMRAIARTAPKK